MATMKDVARVADVSVATVSRVLSGSAAVSEDVKERVNLAIEELQYSTNRIARGLRKRQTNMVAVVMRDVYNTYDCDILRGIEDVLSTGGYYPVLFRADGNSVLESEAIKTAWSINADGMLIAPGPFDQNQFEDVSDLECPCVFMDTWEKDQNGDGYVVNPDYVQMGQIAAKEFSDLGKKQLVYVTNRNRKAEDNPLYQAFSEQGKSEGIETEYWILDKGQRGRRKFSEILDTTEKSLGLLVDDGILGTEIMKVLYKKHLSVPGNTAVICADNSLLAKACIPPLTVVGPTGYQLGFAAAKKLVKLLQQEKIEDTYTKILTKIVKRGSA